MKTRSYKFHVWTVNDGEVARRFADPGAYSFTTDRPTEFHQKCNSAAICTGTLIPQDRIVKWPSSDESADWPTVVFDGAAYCRDLWVRDIDREAASEVIWQATAAGLNVLIGRED